LIKYDFLIIGAGLFGTTFAYEAKLQGKKSLVIDKRLHLAGNVYTEKIEEINVHKYGPHIFHTDNEVIWNYVNRFVKFNAFRNNPIANYHDELYNLPFNMNTFYKMFGTTTPSEAKKIIDNEIKEYKFTDPQNLEEQAISLVGKTIYEKLIKGYTEKQWGRPATQIPSFIIKRLPVRFTFDNNYFNHKFQGVPIGGYTQIVEKMLDGIDVLLNIDYFKNRAQLDNIAEKIVYTGMIDEYFDYKFGRLEYRSLEFKNKVLSTPNYQGVAVMNYTSKEVPYTRIIEHKHFEFGKQEKTVITEEYSREWKQGDEPYYPINDDKNNEKFRKYKEMAKKESNVIFGGRLADYKYYDMHNVIERALEVIKEILGKNSID